MCCSIEDPTVIMLRNMRESVLKEDVSTECVACRNLLWNFAVLAACYHISTCVWFTADC